MTEGLSSDAQSGREILIRGGRVYDHDGDIDDPPVRDILIRGSRIVSVTATDEDGELKQEIVSRAAISNEARVIEARGKLVIPGFVNSHYHSYDVLAKGLLEDMPFDIWALHSQPAYFGPRSRSELRIRTLLGALECIRNGITTLQDMNSLVPQDEETLDVILSAYAEIGIRVVFSIAVRDVGRTRHCAVSTPGRVRSRPGDHSRRLEGRPGGDRVRRAPDQTADALAAAPHLGLEPLRAAAFIACVTRRRQRPCAALWAADLHPCV